MPNNFKIIIENIEKYDIVLLLYENEHSLTLKQAIKQFDKPINSIALIVGPEGGFSSKEVELLSTFDNVKLVTLGNRILRTETAGICAISMLNYEFDM
jgi:16S rRNA (uracil1498-N3)-methyltransferase